MILVQFERERDFISKIIEVLCGLFLHIIFKTEIVIEMDIVKTSIQSGVVVHNCNSCTEEAETGGSL